MFLAIAVDMLALFSSECIGLCQVGPCFLTYKRTKRGNPCIAKAFGRCLSVIVNGRLVGRGMLKDMGLGVGVTKLLA